MAQAINTLDQRNRWGSLNGFEPQRADLFYVDFTAAVSGIKKATGLSGIGMLPLLVRSFTPPELRTKSEPIRRNSIASNMPSWDDPLDAIKIVFILDNNRQANTSVVIQFLDAWLALSRAGRGDRTTGYTGNQNWLLLNENFSVDFQFNVDVQLLAGMDVAEPVYSALQIQSTYTLSNAWLGGYKLDELTHQDSKLVMVDATFYADDYYLNTAADRVVSGSAIVI